MELIGVSEASETRPNSGATLFNDPLSDTRGILLSFSYPDNLLQYLFPLYQSLSLKDVDDRFLGIYVDHK